MTTFGHIELLSAAKNRPIYPDDRPAQDPGGLAAAKRLCPVHHEDIHRSGHSGAGEHLLAWSSDADSARPPSIPRGLESAVSININTMQCGDGDVLAKCRHLANRGIS